MSLLVTFNGQNYIIPTPGEINWGSNLDDYLVAIAAGSLQKTGGSFTLSSELDFGTPFGIKSFYYKSRSSNVAGTGVLRLANGDEISWRNNTNSSDLPLTVNASDQLIYNGSIVALVAAPNTFTSLTLSDTSNQLHLGTTNTITLTAPTPAASRTYTIPDVLTNASFVMTEGNQSINGNKTFNDIIYGAAANDVFVSTNSVNDAKALTLLNSNTGALSSVHIGLYHPSDTGGDTAIVMNIGSGPTYWTLGLDNSDSDSFKISQSNFALGTNDFLKISTAGAVSLTGALLGISGSAASPGVAVGETSTGIYKRSPGVLGLSAGGVEVLVLTSGEVLSASTGSVSAPAFSFLTGQTTGLYLTAGPILNVAVNGTLSTSFRDPGLLAAEGSVSAPSYAFISDPDTGFFHSTANELRLATGGVLSTLFTAAGISTGTVQIDNGAVGTPSLTFQTDTDTGLYRLTTNKMALATNGTAALTIDASQQIGIGQTTPVSIFDVESTTGEVRVTLKNQTTANLIGFDLLSEHGGTNQRWIVGNNVNNTDGSFEFRNQTTGANILELTSAVKARGTATNDNAPAGFIGEFVSSVISSDTNFPTSPNWGDLTSISLTAGDWDVTVQIVAESQGGTWTVASCGLSSTSGNSTAGLSVGDTLMRASFASSSTTPLTVPLVVASSRITLTATTTYYLKIQATYSAGQPTCKGRISARRTR